MDYFGDIGNATFTIIIAPLILAILSRLVGIEKESRKKAEVEEIKTLADTLLRISEIEEKGVVSDKGNQMILDRVHLEGVLAEKVSLFTQHKKEESVDDSTGYLIIPPPAGFVGYIFSAIFIAHSVIAIGLILILFMAVVEKFSFGFMFFCLAISAIIIAVGFLIRFLCFKVYREKNTKIKANLA